MSGVYKNAWDSDTYGGPATVAEQRVWAEELGVTGSLSGDGWALAMAEWRRNAHWLMNEKLEAPPAPAFELVDTPLRVAGLLNWLQQVTPISLDVGHFAWIQPMIELVGSRYVRARLLEPDDWPIPGERSLTAAANGKAAAEISVTPAQGLFQAIDTLQGVALHRLLREKKVRHEAAVVAAQPEALSGLPETTAADALSYRPPSVDGSAALLRDAANADTALAVSGQPAPGVTRGAHSNSAADIFVGSFFPGSAAESIALGSTIPAMMAGRTYTVVYEEQPDGRRGLHVHMEQ